VRFRVLAPPAILLLSLAASAVRPPAYDVIVRGGTVIDGTGSRRQRADVGISGDRIVAVGSLAESTAARVIDATGLIVAPGFIDMLGWSQHTILVDNRGISKVTQGITTEITGEGWSPAPSNERTIAEDSAQFRAWGLTVDWRDLNGYFARLEREGLPFNLATFTGATTLRLYVMGHERRVPRADEMAQMEALLDTAMMQGSLGLSTALIYEPGSYASTAELIALARVAQRRGGLYASHIRSEGDGIDRALDEAFAIGRGAQIPVEVWHLKLSGRRNWGRMAAIIRRFERERNAGRRVGANSYPYIASATSLSQVLPSWVRAGGAGAMVARLQLPQVRERIHREVRGASGVLVLSTVDTTLARYQGRRISDIARAEGKRELDVVMDLLIADGGVTGAAFFAMDERDVTRAVATEWIGVGSDFGATGPDGVFRGPVHPRAYGTFPRILGRYVRDLRALSLEAAVHKMTGIPAQRMGLNARGLVREGYFADLVLFDPETVADQATFESTHQVSRGIRYVMVNGRLTMDDGQLTAERPGRPIRGPGWVAP